MTHAPLQTPSPAPCDIPALRSALPTAVTLLRVYGEDAFSYLQSQVTADLRIPGERWVCYALWLDAKGYVQADSFILREAADSFLLFSYHTPADRLEQIVLANVIADDVEVEHLGADYRHWALWAQNAGDSPAPVGKSAQAQSAVGSPAPVGESAQAAGGAGKEMQAPPAAKDRSSAFLPMALQPQAGCFVHVDGVATASAASSQGGEGTAQRPALLFAGRNTAGENYDLLIPKALPLPPFVAALCEVRWAQRQARRIADGIPAVPADIGPGDLPQEGGDLPRVAVSTAKGCYLGQEVIARWHATLQVRSGLFRLRLLPGELFQGAAPALPLRLYAGDKPVGELRSYAPEAAAGLALLRLHRLGEARALGIEAGGQTVFEVLEPVLS